MTLHRIIASAALLALAAIVPAENLLIRGGRVVTVDGPTIEKGFVLLGDDGLITAIGPVEDLQRMRIRIDRTIEADGLEVYPGFFAAWSNLGLVEVNAVAVTDDSDENSGTNTAQCRVIDSYNPLASTIPVTRVNGVTTALVAPAPGNVFTGQTAVFSLRGGTVDEALVRSPVSLHITLGEYSKERFDGKSTYPSTRMGLAAYIRGEFIAAQEYADKWAKHERETATYEKKKTAYATDSAAWTEDSDKDRPEEPGPPEPPTRDLTKDALVLALKGEIRVVFEAYRVDDMDTAMRIAQEFDLNMVILGATDAWKIAPILAQRQIPVIIAATEQPDTMQTQGAIYENARLLHEAGVPFALYHPDGTHNVRNLPYEAALAVAWGLPWDAALRAVTLSAAEIWDLGHELGSLTPGKRASLIITDGDPLRPQTRILHVFIDGEEMTRTTRQSTLAEEHGGEHLPDEQRVK